MKDFAKEVFRKILHMMAIAFSIFWFYMYDDWRKSVFAVAMAGVLLYPLLLLCAKVPRLSNAVNARWSGEFASSFSALMAMYIIVASICWGRLGERMLGIAAIIAWGPGDAAAALIGKRFGKHKIGKSRKKSLEGTISMFIVSFISLLIVLFIYGKYSTIATVVVALIAAIVSAGIELNIENGYDTFYCPIGTMVVLVIAELILR